MLMSFLFQPRTSLEKEIAAVLKGSAPILERKNKELTEEEEKALQAVDLQEVGFEAACHSPRDLLAFLHKSLDRAIYRVSQRIVPSLCCCCGGAIDSIGSILHSYIGQTLTESLRPCVSR